MPGARLHSVLGGWGPRRALPGYSPKRPGIGASRAVRPAGLSPCGGLSTPACFAVPGRAPPLRRSPAPVHTHVHPHPPHPTQCARAQTSPRLLPSLPGPPPPAPLPALLPPFINYHECNPSPYVCEPLVPYHVCAVIGVGVALQLRVAVAAEHGPEVGVDPGVHQRVKRRPAARAAGRAGGRELVQELGAEVEVEVEVGGCEGGVGAECKPMKLPSGHPVAFIVLQMVSRPKSLTHMHVSVARCMWQVTGSNLGFRKFDEKEEPINQRVEAGLSTRTRPSWGLTGKKSRQIVWSRGRVPFKWGRV